MSSIIPKAPSLMVFSSAMFPMSMPLSTAMPGSNSIPSLSDSVEGDVSDAPADDPRIFVDISTFEKEEDPALDIAFARFGGSITDTLVLTDNGITEGRIDAFRKLMGLNGPSISDRLDELFNELGMDDGGVRESLDGADRDGRRVIKIRGEGSVPPEYFKQYSFLQGTLLPVPLVSRVYTNELYRGLHARFVATDLDLLRDLPKKIHNHLSDGHWEVAEHMLIWAKSMALGIEVGARQIIDAGSEDLVSSVWNDDARDFLATTWGFFNESDRVLLGESNVGSAAMQVYLSALVYVNPK